MGINNRSVDKAGETAADFQDSGNSACIQKAQNFIADKLHDVAEALGEKFEDGDAQSGMAHGKQASEWLEQSAEHVRQFSYEQADAGVREYVRQSPGLSLLIAGAVGVVFGAILRRR